MTTKTKVTKPKLDAREDKRVVRIVLILRCLALHDAVQQLRDDFEQAALAGIITEEEGKAARVEFYAAEDGLESARPTFPAMTGWTKFAELTGGKVGA